MKLLIHLIAVAAIIAPVGASQPWANILPTSRAIRWDQQAGLPSCIPYGTGGTGAIACANIAAGIACNGTSANCVELISNAWTPPARVQCTAAVCGGGSPLLCANTSADATTINNALAAAFPGSYVLLGATTCQITGDIVMQPGVTLRGSGPMSTILNWNSTTARITWGAMSTTNNGALSGSPAAGATSMTITGGTGTGASGAAMPGTIAYLSQCNTGYTGWSTDRACSTGTASDNGAVYVCDDTGCASNATNTHGGQVQGFFVTGVTGNCSSSCTVTFKPPLAMGNWTSANSAHLEWGSGPTNGAGLEDLSILLPSSPLLNTTPLPIQGYGSWIKGIRIAGPTGNGATPQSIFPSGVNFLIMNNYSYGQGKDYAQPGNNEPYNYTFASFGLVLNNIINGGNAIWGAGYNTGNVFAYDYDPYATSADVQNYLNDNHGPGTSQFTLAEGLQFPQINLDDNHTTNNLLTGFRNLLTLSDGPIYNNHKIGVNVSNLQRFANFVGNVIGNDTAPANETFIYQGTGCSGSTCNIFAFPGADGLTKDGHYRWGNVNSVDHVARWCGRTDPNFSNPPCSSTSEVPDSTTMSAGTYPSATGFQVTTPSNHQMPCTLLFSSSSANCTIKTNGGTGLSFWKVATAWSSFPSSPTASSTPPYPPAGPDQTGGPYVSGFAYDIPAAVAFKNLPIDSSLQGTFTITASSFTNTGSNCTSFVANIPGPCETLTITTNANINAGSYHVVGGFQFGAGINAACKPTTGASYTGRSDGEILILGNTQGAGSTITVVYALPGQSSDPGCTGGTFNWPDARQFDQRIYMADPVALSGPRPTRSVVICSGCRF